jgi:putative PIN family toxin of toxin-antitoxin system
MVQPNRPPLRVVLDANVFVSGSVSRKGYEGQILDLAADEQIVLVLCNYILEETRRHIRGHGGEVGLFWFNKFIDRIQFEHVADPSLFEVFQHVNLVPGDMKDVPVALVAINNRVDYLISGDTHLNAGDRTTFSIDARIRVMKPRAFIEMIERQKAG